MSNLLIQSLHIHHVSVKECKCVNGRCKDGVDGDGSCTCDLGWRGINCNVGMMLTCRTNIHLDALYHINKI